MADAHLTETIDSDYARPTALVAAGESTIALAE